MPDQNRILRLLKTDLAVSAPSCDLEIFIFGEINVNGIVDKYFSALNKLKCRNGSSDLRAGIHVMKRIGAHWRAVFKIIITALVAEDLLMILIDHSV